ncbi:molybdopterin-dependent oxidoreductase, partial [Actinosynnema sp. NPDC004786]
MDTSTRRQSSEAGTPRLRSRAAVAVGLVAVAAALAAGHLVAALTDPLASPFLAVGNTAIDLTPHPVKDFAVRTFGEHDKAVLLAGMATVVAAAAVLAGLLSRRGPLPGTLLAAALGVLGVAAVLTRPTLGAIALAAPLAGLAVGVLVFRRLHRLARHSPADTPAAAEPHPIDSTANAGAGTRTAGSDGTATATAIDRAAADRAAADRAAADRAAADRAAADRAAASSAAT